MQFRLAGVAAAMVVGVSACGDRRSDNDAAAPVPDRSPTLSAEAREAAVSMINADLNAPFVEIHGRLAQAASDGVIGSEELWLPSMTDAAWWYWNSGYLSLSEDQTHFVLSRAGQNLIDDGAPVWLQANVSGAPTMECQSAGSLTSANCTAQVLYEVETTAEANVGRMALPADTAFLAAAFAPGEGWRVTELNVEGDVPSQRVWAALFGDTAANEVGRERFVTNVRSLLEETQAEPPGEADEFEPAASDVQADVERPSSKPVAERSTAARSPSPPTRPSVIVNPEWRRAATAEELAALYPPNARARRLAGRSELECVAAADGSLRSCDSLAESPPGSRFGQAGTLAARFYRLNPQTPEGASVEGARVRFSIDWRLD